MNNRCSVLTNMISSDPGPRDVLQRFGQQNCKPPIKVFRPSSCAHRDYEACIRSCSSKNCAQREYDNKRSGEHDQGCQSTPHLCIVYM